MIQLGLLSFSIEWFHLVGLIHDVGKIMALFDVPQHFVVGDTFPVGCKFSDKIVFAEQFVDNPDTKIPEYRYYILCYDYLTNIIL